MEPNDPQDPLWKLLGRAQHPKVRERFLADVVREARHTAQDRGAWVRLKAWWADSADFLPAGRTLAAVAVIVVIGLVSFSVFSPSLSESGLNELASDTTLIEANEGGREELPLVAEVETQLESLDYLDALLAVEDTSGFTDSEIAYLLY